MHSNHTTGGGDWKQVLRHPLVVGALLLVGVLVAGTALVEAQTSPTPNGAAATSTTTPPSTNSIGTGTGGTGMSGTDGTATTTNGTGVGGTGTMDDVNTGTSGTGTGTGTSTGVTETSQGINAAALTPLPLPGTTPAPIIVSVDNAGNTLVRGIVQSIDGNSMTIMSWGGIWTIRSGGTGATTVVPIGIGGVSDFSAIIPGHIVGVQGVMASNQDMTINAEFVRDWSTNPFMETGLNFGTQATSPSPGTGNAGGGTGSTEL